MEHGGKLPVKVLVRVVGVGKQGVSPQRDIRLFVLFQKLALPKALEKRRIHFCDFLGEHLNSTLVVTGAERGAGQNDVGSPSGLDTYVKNYPVNSMFIRHELDTNTYYVSTKRLSSWCSMNGISLSVMLQELKRTGEWDGSGKFQFSLGKNVLAVDRSRVMVYKFVLHK